MLKSAQMNFHAGLYAVALTLLGAPASGQSPDNQQLNFEDADRRVVRLPPQAFPQLAHTVARELERRACTIPQTSDAKKLENVIRGEFARTGQTDWAVLCSINRKSTILVFWNGSIRNPAEIASMEDRIFLQTNGDGQIVFSRAISPVDAHFIMGHYRAYGGPQPPPIQHQGIDDAFLGKASVTWYFHDRRWLKLTGAD